MSADTWVKLHRDTSRWEWYQDSKMFHLFMHLIINANWEDSRWMGHEIKRGQLPVGRKKLSSDTGISERSIRTCLRKLEESGEINTKTTSKFSLVTICNYNKYQDNGVKSDQQGDQQVTIKRPASDQQTTTLKEVKNKRIKETTKSFNPVLVKPGNIDLEDWSDLITHRKKVKATETERAYKTIISQIAIAEGMGFSAKACIDEICNRSWRGFKADWMSNSSSKKSFKTKTDINTEIQNIGASINETTKFNPYADIESSDGGRDVDQISLTLPE